MDWDLKLGRMMEEDGAPPVARRRRTASSSGGPQPVTCLVDGCTWDLNNCREYHRRHRVCERHSKTPVVLVAGQEQRFCQQCSRFHSLGEFDEAKRSCRKRLDGHNRRRRKTQPESVYINSAVSASGIASACSTPTTTLLQPPPPHFHRLMTPPVLMYPPSATAWPLAAPPPPPQPYINSSSFGYVGRHHGDENAASVGLRSDGHIDCALSLLSSGTRVQTQQQQGFHGGACTSSTAAAHCYDGFDDDDGAPCRMFPFSWD